MDFARLWPTPNTHIFRHAVQPTKERPSGAKAMIRLQDAVAFWPTPDASASNVDEKPETWLARRERVKAKGINGNGMGMPLAIAAQLWPTPTSSDSTRASETFMRGNPTLRGAAGGKLNPTWVEWLMGWPLGHTVCAPSATARSRSPRRPRGACSEGREP